MQTNKGFNLAGKKLMIGLPAYDHKVTVSMAVSLMKLSQMVLQHGIDIQVNSICGCSLYPVRVTSLPSSSWSLIVIT